MIDDFLLEKMTSSSNSFTKEYLRPQVLDRRMIPAMNEATDFYTKKLENYPGMPRYNHYMAAISMAKGDVETADNYYRQTMMAAPGDIMVKNDFAMHLNALGRKEESIKELKKATLITEENATIQKNLGALYGNTGDTHKALTHSLRAKYINPNDPMNHRNLAKIYNAMGDTDTSLEHNLKSIDIEENPRFGRKPNTKAYRQAAVQIIAKGGSREDALSLMDRARIIENQHTKLSTTERTVEIIAKIRKQQSYHYDQLERMKREEEEQKKASTKAWMDLIEKMK